MRGVAKGKFWGGAILVFLLIAAFGSIAAAQDVTLRVMRPGYPEEARDFLSRAAAEYTKTHPNVKIEIVDADFNTFHDRIMVWVSGGQEPDVYMTSITEFPDLVDMGAVLPLDDTIDEALRNDVAPSVWDTYRIDGTIYGFPASVTSIGLWYNKDLFKQAGLDPEQPPRTWDEMLADAQAIEEKTDADGLGLNLGRFADTTMNLAGVLFFSGTNRPLITPAGEPLFNSPEGAKTLQFIDDLVNKYEVTEPHPVQYTKGDIRLLLRDGKVAMAADGPWIMSLLGEVTDLSSPETSKFGLAPVPAPSIEGKKAMTTMGADPWVVSANSKHPEEAKEFLRFLVTPEWQYAHDLAVHQPPFRRSIWAEKGDAVENAWIYRQLADGLDNAIIFSPVVPKASRVLEIFNQALQLAVLGEASPQEALDDAANQIKDLYQ